MSSTQKIPHNSQEQREKKVQWLLERKFLWEQFDPVPEILRYGIVDRMKDEGIFSHLTTRGDCYRTVTKCLAIARARLKVSV